MLTDEQEWRMRIRLEENQRLLIISPMDELLNYYVVDVGALRDEVDRLWKIIPELCDRVAGQAELIARRADKKAFL